ncbi:Histidine kinase-, DNA gyrase B-, and HSP90-like ATPase [Carpediemonas membranifera]|uniref:Histidine kinase-, DNA gyrase B-, and HSP90-like ATPase n=1 Tax=Carpediemonas membranifera TaxID=201153 RepID=A0A8J6DZ99_9EUKA|nr:Histidine kinase-, DNA gyrase B-, and HSP90-like ATPase [Carpediemonas membranifera]|eukprot:KAG9390428.1 Histidine kinase-, DNA gyrase B-, and HSP90-like ATPase [Carpediemonas membranifera]
MDEREQLIAQLRKQRSEIDTIRSEFHAVELENEAMKAAMIHSSALFLQISPQGTILLTNTSFKAVYTDLAAQDLVSGTLLNMTSTHHHTFVDFPVRGRQRYTIAWVAEAAHCLGELHLVGLIGVVLYRATIREDQLTNVNLFQMMNSFALESSTGFWIAEIAPHYKIGIRIMFVSRLIPKWFEVSAAAMCDDSGVGWMRPIVPDMLDQVLSALRDFISGETDEYHEVYKIVCPQSGTERWIRARAIKLKNGGETQPCFGTVEDITASVEADTRNRKLAKILNFITEAMPDILWVADVSIFRQTGLLKTLVVTNVWETISGIPISEEDITVDDFRPALDPNEADWFITRLGLFLEGVGPMIDFDHSFVNVRTGQVHRMRLNGKHVLDGEGRLKVAVLVGTDNTKAYMVEKKARETKLLFDRMSECISDVFCIVIPLDYTLPRGVEPASFPPFKFVSDGVLNLLGIPAEAFLTDSKAWLETIVPEGRPRVVDALVDYNNACLTEPENASLNVTFAVSVGGVTKHIQCKNKPILNMRGKVTRLVGSFTDITGLVRKQADLSQAIQQFDLISENIQTIFYLMDAKEGSDDFGVIYINRAYETLTGRTREAILRRGSDEWWEQVHPDDKSGAQTTFVTFGHETRYRRYRIIRDDGQLRHVIIRRVQVDEVGCRLRVVGFIVDITDLVESQQRKNEAQAQMNRAQQLESLGVLAGGMAHEFGNLLAVIMGNADLALDLAGPDPCLMETLEAVVEACTKASVFTGQLLAYSGKGQMVMMDVNLTSLIRGMIDFIQASLPRNVTLTLKLSQESTLPLIRGDPSQLRQAVSVIVSNGVEAIGTKPGHLIISTGHCQCEGNPCVCLSVTDTGVGMDEETRSRLFDPFYTTKEAGKGLSLAAVHGIISNHGGKLEVASAPGEGCTITARFKPESNECQCSPSQQETQD